MMPDRTADAGAGATGWAVGSQDCSGIMPALQPKPIIIKSQTVNSRFSFPAAREKSSVPPAENSVVEQYRLRKKNPINARPAPKVE